MVACPECGKGLRELEGGYFVCNNPECLLHRRRDYLLTLEQLEVLAEIDKGVEESFAKSDMGRYMRLIKKSGSVRPHGKINWGSEDADEQVVSEDESEEKKPRKLSEYKESGSWLNIDGDTFYERDLPALETARRAVVPDEKWKGYSQDEKAKTYKNISRWLSKFEKSYSKPIVNKWRKQIGDALNSGEEQYQVTEVIKGANALERMRTLPEKKKRKYQGYFLAKAVTLKEDLEKKRKKPSSAATSETTSPSSEPVPTPDTTPASTPPTEPSQAAPSGPEGQLCPTCGRIFGREMRTLRNIQGTQRYVCDHCNGEFIITDRGMLPIQIHTNVENAPTEICPRCVGKNKIKVEKFKTPQQGTIFRLKCENPRCEGREIVNPAGTRILKPWFMDLAERDYEHWIEVRKRRKFEQLEVLKNLPPLANSRLQGRREREIKRMGTHINESGFTNAYAERLGITEAGLINSGFDPKEPEMFSDDEQGEFKQRDALLDEELSGRSSEGIRKFSENLRRNRVGKFFQGFQEHSAMKEHGTQAVVSLILLLFGAVIGAVLGWPFIVAFAAWAARNMLPDPKKIKQVKDFERNRFGSLFAKSAEGDEDVFNNRYSTGIAVSKSMLKIVILFFFGWGFFVTDLPFRGFLLLVFFFTAYFTVPGEYSTDEPQKFMEGILRPPLAILLAWFVFFGIFKSTELAWLTMAFFAVLPVVSERRNIARAIGNAGSGVTTTYETVDKFIFAILMIIGAGSVMWGGGMNLDLGTIFGNIFFPFWIVAFLGGLTSPAQVRPYTGVIVLVMVFIFYTAGTGEQIVGQGFFGEWWPTAHNAITSLTEPLGEMFSTLQGTFGQTFLLLTNPVGFSKQIMEGSYVKSPTGPTGSYGVEIENLQIPALYPGTPNMATLNIKNVGPVKARNVVVRIGMPAEFKDVLTLQGRGNINLDDNKIDKSEIPEFGEMNPNFIVPLFFIIDASDCDAIKKSGWFSRLSDRNRYIRVNVSVEYDYEVSSWMPLTVISDQEWRDRTIKGTFNPVKVQSYISTSPVKLSLGSFDQPLVAGDMPFYIGFNSTSAEGKGSKILDAEVVLEYPKEIETDQGGPDCKPKGNNGELTWHFNDKPDPPNSIRFQAVFCTFPKTPDPVAPSKTYYIQANSTFRFEKTETKDTLFTFSDVCPKDTGSGS